MNAPRTVPAHEYWPCFFGSGECQIPAEFVEDDGDGGDAYMCPKHHKEFLEMDARLASDLGLSEKLAAAIDRHE